MDDLNKQKFKSFLTVPRIIFLVLGIIILVEVVYAVRVLTSRFPVPSLFLPTGNVVQKTIGKISLNVPKTSFNAAETIPVSVIIDTGSNTISGADLIVRFDPKILEATPEDLVRGKIFDGYPVMSVDAKKGLISISGINSLKNGFKGSGQFALINLKAKAQGKTTLTIDFKKGSTTDSNLVEVNSSKDVLESVDNLELNIQ